MKGLLFAVSQAAHDITTARINRTFGAFNSNVYRPVTGVAIETSKERLIGCHYLRMNEQ